MEADSPRHEELRIFSFLMSFGFVKISVWTVLHCISWTEHSGGCKGLDGHGRRQSKGQLRYFSISFSSLISYVV